MVIPIRHLRGQVASLAPAFENLDVDKSRGALIHVYEAEAKGEGNSGEMPVVSAPVIAWQLSLSAYPNSFNPATQIRFTLPVKSFCDGSYL